MKKILQLVVISFIMMPLWLCGQEPQMNDDEIELISILDKIDAMKNAVKDTIADTSDKKEIDSTYRASKARRFPDVSNYYSECYENITTKYGLWQGIGEPLNKTQQNRCSHYYKLLRPKDSSEDSPYTCMQIVNSYGKLTTNHTYGPIMANPFIEDAGMSRDWQKKLKTVCQVEQIIFQGLLLQENLYDKDGKLVLQYYPTYTKKNCVFGHYTDPNGSLAHLRTDSKAAYISIEFDDNGYIARVIFTDEDRQYKRNGDGVFIQLFKNDSIGNRVCAQSANALGQPIIDNWGNCGWKYIYDDQGRVKTITCIDQNGSPMRMPSTKSTILDIGKIEKTYDNYGNLETESYYDLDGKPDTNSQGVHKQVYTYDKHGNAKSWCAQDLDGTLVNYDHDLAKWERQYDEDGNLHLEVRYNKDGRFSKNSIDSIGESTDEIDNRCVLIYNYSKGRMTMEENYETNNGTDTILVYKKTSNLEADTIWSKKTNEINIKKYDQKYRILSDTYYDLGYNPIDNENGWHQCVYDYKESPKFSMSITQYLDTNGSLVNIDKSSKLRYNKLIIEVDSITHTMIYSKWDGDKFLEKYQNKLDENYQYQIAVGFYDKLGGRGRTSMAKAFYYEVEEVVDNGGNGIVWCSLNEFGEPAYSQLSDGDEANIYCYYIRGESDFSDENGNIIIDHNYYLKQFKEDLNKSFIIELTDSCAYRYGLRTGDVIVRYGDWYCVEPQRGSINDSRNLLCYETALKANTTKTITVMRHDPATKTSKLIDFELPVGTPQQLGFLYHINYMTTREADRYNQVIADSKKFEGIDTEDKNERNDRIYFIYPHKIGDNKDKKVFVDGFRENAIILGWEVYDYEHAYFFSCHNKYIDIDKAFSQNIYDPITLYYTTDCRTVKKYIFKNHELINDLLDFVSLNNSEITDGSMIYKLADSLQAAFDEEHPRFHLSLTPHKVYDTLKSIGVVRYDYYNDDIVTCVPGVDSDYKKIIVNNNVLSYKELFFTTDIFLNIDLSDYMPIMNKKDNIIYGHVNKSKIDELLKISIEDRSISFVYGDFKIDPKYAPMMIVFDDLNASVKQGNYMILQCGSWHWGMDVATLENILKNKSEISQITIAQVNWKNGKYSLSQYVTVPMSPADWNKMEYSWQVAHDPLLFEAVKQVKRLK